MAIETGAGYKVAGAAVTFSMPILAFFLGLQVIPLSKTDPHRDVVRRILGCVVSSFTLGPVGLVAIYKLAPWVYDACFAVAEKMFDLGPLGYIWLTALVLLLSALPGWWLVGALVREVAGWDGKSLAEIAQDVSGDMEKVKGAIK